MTPTRGGGGRQRSYSRVSCVLILCRDLAVDAFILACEEGLDILFDRTLANPDDARRIVDFARQRGYWVVLIGVTVDVGEAIHRAEARGRDTGRFVPEGAIRDSHRGFSKSFPEIVDFVDEAYLYDTGRGDDHVIAQKREGGAFEILDQVAYDSFIEKGAA